MSKVSTTLRAARDLMNDQGAHWTRHDLRVQSPDGYRYCALGAIFQVTGTDLDKIVKYDPDDGYQYPDTLEARKAIFEEGDVELRQEAIRALHDEIVRSGFDKPDWSNLTQVTSNEDLTWTITNWNDRGTRTWEEVAAMFENAARHAEENA